MRKPSNNYINHDSERVLRNDYGAMADFAGWLLSNGYKEYGISGNKSTVYQYSKYIEDVMKRERMSQLALQDNIAQIVKKYDVGGECEELGQRGHRTCINALKKYYEYVGTGAPSRERKTYSISYSKLMAESVQKGSENKSEKGAGGEDKHATTSMSYEEAVRNIPLGKYRHFKGNDYEVLFIAHHSETDEPMVVYRALYGNREVWIRPASMWNEIIERDGVRRKRFARIVD